MDGAALNSRPHAPPHALKFEKTIMYVNTAWFEYVYPCSLIAIGLKLRKRITNTQIYTQIDRQQKYNIDILAKTRGKPSGEICY
jgi:hypothetical protein